MKARDLMNPKLRDLMWLTSWNAREGIYDEGDFYRRLRSLKVPGICINAGCNRTYVVQPKEQHGHCENCKTPSVVSARILMGV